MWRGEMKVVNPYEPPDEPKRRPKREWLVPAVIIGLSITAIFGLLVFGYLMIPDVRVFDEAGR